MAGASSSSAGGSRKFKYHVFINFRGENTRKCFVCHLYEALKQKTLDTFIDSEELRKGEELSKLLEAIKGSKLSIVIFSKDYASSTWCLRELVQILKCKDQQGQIVVPVFYEVDPSEVRKLDNEAFAKHESDPKVDNEEMKSWKSALTNAANLSGYHSTKYQDDLKLIKSIVEDIFKKLIPNSPSKTDGLIGMDSHLDEMDARMKLEEDDCRIVGIWGMGGLGKSTIAEAVYEKLSPQFEHKCFLHRVKDNVKEQMFKTLVCTILKMEDQRTLDGCLNRVRERLGEKKILLVLDDVDRKDQIDTLIGENPSNSFGGGSRVIITTRDRNLLAGFSIYKPNLFTTEKSLELLCRHAFRTIKYSDSYDAISRSVVEYAQGLPLALKVLGGLLDNKTVQQWEYELEKIKKIPMTDVRRVLRASYDGLDDRQQKIFLDIACFFRGEKKDSVTEFHESCEFFPQNGLTVLIERSLLTVSKYGELDMHDLIQEMGRDIVRQESTDKPWKRSRLWDHEDVVEVLAKNKGKKSVQGIILDLSKLNDEVLCVNKAALAGMKNLRMLKLTTTRNMYGRQCVTGSGDLKLSNKLRYLFWHGYPLESLPSHFSTKNLIRIDMRHSNLKQLWVETKYLQNLVDMDLSGSKDLIRTPDFSDAKKLKRLTLEGCSSLLEVDPSISALESICYLELEGCSNLGKFPNICGNMKELTYLSLDESAITEVPSSVNDLPGLETLSLGDCRELRSLPSSIHMKSLEYLYLSGCSKLAQFPNISGNMKELTSLYLHESAITEVPSSVNDLPGLKTLSLRDCRELRSLPSSIHMKSLEYLYLSGCSKLAQFPEISEVMADLCELELDDTAIENLPSSIINFTSLSTLSMRRCRSLVCLPEEICDLECLKRLDLTGCSNMEKLPENFANSKSLTMSTREEGCEEWNLMYYIKSVSFKGCKKITAPFSSWPTWNNQIPCRCVESALLYLDLSDCNLLELSDAIAHLSSLEGLKLSGNKNLESLPAAMNRLVHLDSLQVEGCMKLKSIPELSSSVKWINADYCTSLETVSAPRNREFYFTFANCLKLQVKTNLFINTVETTIVNQVDASGFGSHCHIFLPGSDIPDGFNHQSRGPSVTVHLPLNWSTDEFQGLAICAISNLRGAQNRKNLESAECCATFKANDGHQDMFYSRLLSTRWDHETEMPLESDHMFLAYMSKSILKMRNSETAGKNYTEATFRIVAKERENAGIPYISETYSRKDCSWITSCGVHLFLANEETFSVIKKQGSKRGREDGDGCAGREFKRILIT